MQLFKWNVEKNERLFKDRGITFEEIVHQIESGVKVVETDHPNQQIYPDQKILILDVEGHTYLIPCIVEHEFYFLQTIIPTSKASKNSQ